MIFEFDPQKSQANLLKHGIDFLEAQHLWHDTNRLEVSLETTTEPRWQVLALYRGKCWSAIITYRETTIRLISVRRARKEEIALYEECP